MNKQYIRPCKEWNIKNTHVIHKALNKTKLYLHELILQRGISLEI